MWTKYVSVALPIIVEVLRAIEAAKANQSGK